LCIDVKDLHLIQGKIIVPPFIKEHYLGFGTKIQNISAVLLAGHVFLSTILERE